MSVDYRTRTDANVADITINEFFNSQFPALVASRQHRVAAWLNKNAPSPLSIQCAGDHWQIRAHNAQLQAVRNPVEASALVHLEADEFSGLVNDLYTPMTFFAGGTLNMERGNVNDFLDWWLLLRALIDDRDIHAGEPLDFPDTNGETLDLQRSFSIDGDLQQMRHFLETAGFIHIAGLFSEQEMAAISRDIDTFQDNYTEGDNKSWWATTANGDRRLVRLQSFDQLSDATARLLQDERFIRLGEISGVGHTHAGLQDNAIEALIKPLNVVQGISDLPWHKDCSLGRHSYECCSLTVGISVTGAGANSGQLRVIAGSHRVLMWPSLIRDAQAYNLPVIDLPTHTGDITMHLSCTHHMAQAPTERERRVLYTSFRLPSTSIDLSNAARERISKSREAAYKTVSQ